MFQKILTQFAALVASVIFVVPALAAEVPTPRATSLEPALVYSVRIPITAAVNDFSRAIPSCPTMYAVWERGNSAVVSLYPADSDDDTVGEIEANTVIKQFTTNEFYGPFTPTKQNVRFVVDTVNASVPSTIKVLCSNIAAGGGTELNQIGGEVDLRYDASIDGYYFDTNGDSSRTTSRTLIGERESGSVVFNDDIWIGEFASGSTTFGLQEAITFACDVIAVSPFALGARIRIPGRYYDFGTATVTIPQFCHGLTIQGAGPGVINGGRNPGTEIRTNQSSGGGFSFLTVSSDNIHIKIQDLAITAREPGGNTAVIVVSGGNAGQFELNRVRIAAVDSVGSPVFDPDGIALYMAEAISTRINESWFEGFGTGVLHTGTTNAGGATYSNNRFRSGSSAGIGLQIGQGGAACNHIALFGNVFEGNHRGIFINTSTSSAVDCKVSSFGNYFENNVSGSEDIRATGSNQIASFGDLFSGVSTYGFHRTTQPRTSAVDTFYAPQIYTDILMDAGRCRIYGVSDVEAADISTCLADGTIEATSSTAYTMQPAQGQWIYQSAGAASQIEMPAAVNGASFCVYSVTAQVISLNPNGTQQIYLDGSPIGAGDELDSPGTGGSFICLQANGTNWYTLGKSGTWADGGPT